MGLAESKKCVLILSYFGKFKNYFQLFLNSVGRNKEYDLLLLTDNYDEYNYPDNVRIIHTTLAAVKETANKKFGFDVRLEKPYKLCDYKPAYGFLFEEYISGYAYWGHCDCDLIFGNLDKLLSPVLDEGYDKLFAAGHLTLYKNDYENNSRFMKRYSNRLIYQEAFTTDKIYVFDEDFSENNVHILFLTDGANVYQRDMSMNPTTKFARFRRSYYNAELRRFKWEPFRKARYYWNNGNITEVEYDEESGQLRQREFIYMHLQQRVMKIKKGALRAKIYQILPDRFVSEEKLPENKKEMKLGMIKCPYTYPYHSYKKRLIRKIKKIRAAKAGREI